MNRKQQIFEMKRLFS